MNGNIYVATELKNKSFGIELIAMQIENSH